MEVLVDDVGELSLVEDEPTTPFEAERVPKCGPVKGDRHRRSPVDDDGLAQAVLYMPATDVPSLAVLGADAPEAQRAGAGGHRCHALTEEAVCDGGVPVPWSSFGCIDAA